MNPRQRFRSHRTPKPTEKMAGSHIVEQTLQKKGELIEKYQTEIQGLLERIDGRESERSATLNVRSARNKAINSIKKSEAIDTRDYYGAKDYQKLILGLQYTLQMERKKADDLQNKNNSLESEIANLRNLLVGPDASKEYERTMVKEAQEKISHLEERIIEQKKNYEFIIDSKNEAISNLEAEIKPLRIETKQNKQKDQDAISKKFLQVMQHNEELIGAINRKNLLIEKLKYGKSPDSDSDEEDVKEVHKKDKLNFYLQQLEVSNKLILRKNIELLTVSKKISLNEEVIKVMEQYLDRKEVKGVDLNILEHPCVNKLRILLREKAMFERELLSQLGEHNKKISLFENEIETREKSATGKFQQAVNDNRRLASLVSTLQTNVVNLERNSDELKRDNEILKAQLEVEKKKFVDEVQHLKSELGNISSVTKQEFDRMKIENLKLSEQNRSLLFLVGQKEKEIMKKGEAIKTFEQYRQKINSLDVGEAQKSRIQSVAVQNPQIGSKLMLISNFSTWLYEWNKLKNWNNKKILLNLILDKQEIRTDSLTSMSYLINVIHEALLQSKNSEIQERGIILLSYYLTHSILKNKDIYLNKITPIIIRGFRPKIENQDELLHRLLNTSTLRITDSLEKMQYKWNFEMTNEMLAVNGLKYLLHILNESHIEDEVERAYNTMTMIGRANEMISFMMSFNVTQFLLKNLKSDYGFIIFDLILMKTLLSSQDYIKAQKSLLEFRKLFTILKQDDDEQLVELTLDCILLLMENSVFVKSLNKIEAMSLLMHTINNQKNYNPLKKAGKIYVQVLESLENENILKFQRVELEKLLQIVRSKRVNELRFNRVLRIIREVAEIFQDQEIDNKIFLAYLPLYENYENVETSSRIKLNTTINFIFERSKELLVKYGSNEVIMHFVEAYKVSANNEEMNFLLKIIYFFGEQKKATEILRNGQESLLTRLIEDSTVPDYNVNIWALKNILILSKEKFIEKFLNKIMLSKLIGKVLNQRSEEEHIDLTLSSLYFLSKNHELSSLAVDCGLVPKVCSVIMQRHEKQAIMFKCFALLEVNHTNNYKRKILNHILANDPNLQIMKTINYILRKNKSKVDLASRAIFIYEFLNSRSSMESFSILVERNTWMIEDLVRLRNDYINKLDPLVYKIELLLHELSQSSEKLAKVYRSFRVQGEESQDDA